MFVPEIISQQSLILFPPNPQKEARRRTCQSLRMSLICLSKFLMQNFIVLENMLYSFSHITGIVKCSSVPRISSLVFSFHSLTFPCKLWYKNLFLYFRIHWLSHLQDQILHSLLIFYMSVQYISSCKALWAIQSQHTQLWMLNSITSHPCP